MIQEPKSWQAIETGANKFFASRPDIMAKPTTWGHHSDNILNEIPVESAEAASVGSAGTKK